MLSGEGSTLEVQSTEDSGAVTPYNLIHGGQSCDSVAVSVSSPETGPPAGVESPRPEMNQESPAPKGEPKGEPTEDFKAESIFGKAPLSDDAPIIPVLRRCMEDLCARLDDHAKKQRSDLHSASGRLEARLDKMVQSQQKVTSTMDIIRQEVRRVSIGLDNAKGKQNTMDNMRGSPSAMSRKRSDRSDKSVEFHIPHGSGNDASSVTLPDAPLEIPKRPLKAKLKTHGTVVRKPVSACRGISSLIALEDKRLSAVADSSPASHSEDVRWSHWGSLARSKSVTFPDTDASAAHQVSDADLSVAKEVPMRTGPSMGMRSTWSAASGWSTHSAHAGFNSAERGGEEFVDSVPLPMKVLSISDLEETFRPLQAGDLVRITKESRLKGQRAVVVDPMWHGLIKVELEKDDAKGNIKSYQKSELEFIPKNDSNTSQSMSDHRPKTLTLSTTWPATVKMRPSFVQNRQSEEINNLLSGEMDITGKDNIRHSYRFLISSGSFNSNQDCRRKFGRVQSEATIARKPHRCVLNPSSLPRMYIDICCIMVLLYDLVLTPFILAWDVPLKGWLMVGMWVTCAFWTGDMCLTLRTGYWHHGNLEMRPPCIVRHYVKTWLLPDFILVAGDWTSNILTILFSGENSSHSARGVTLLRLSKAGKLIRVLGVIRMVKLSELFERLSFLNGGTHDVFVQIPQLFILIIWVNHVIGCIWFAIGRSAPSDTGLHWLDAQIAGFKTQEGEIVKATYRDAEVGFQYTTAFHWALTQMTPGSMQVHALSTIERTFNNCCLILGLMFFGTLISMLTAKMTQYRMLKQAKTTTILTLRRFLHQNNFSKDLAVSVQKQVMERISAPKMLRIQDVPAIHMLSLSLRTELEYELCRPHFVGHSFFLLCDKVDGTAMRHLCRNAIEIAMLSAGDNVFLAASQADHGYCVAHGRLHYTQEPKTSKVTRTLRQVVQTGDWLSEIALYAHWSHVGTVEASSSCELLIISAAKYVEALQTQALIWQAAQSYASSFHKILTNSTPPKAWPTDIHTDIDDIFWGMSREVKFFIGLVAIDVLKRNMWQFKLSHKTLSHLEDEVRKGQCTLVLKKFQQVSRITALVTLRMQRQDQRILCQLARIKEDHTVRIECLLPGTKQMEQEEADHAVHRLISQKLSPFEAGLQLGERDCSTEEKPSTRFRIPSKYISSNYFAEFVGDVDLPALQIIRPVMEITSETQHWLIGTPQPLKQAYCNSTSSSTTGRSSSGMPCPNVFCISSKDGLNKYLYAWLTDEEMDAYHTHSGRKELLRWISSLDLGDDSEGIPIRLSNLMSQRTEF